MAKRLLITPPLHHSRAAPASVAPPLAPTGSAENAEHEWEWFRAGKLAPLPFHPSHSSDDAVALNPRQ